MKMGKFLSISLFTVSLLLPIASLQAATISPNIFTDPDLGTDPVNCSLRYAIQSINNGATFEGGCGSFFTGVLGTDDTIVLQAGEYQLTVAGNGNDDNDTGDLDVLVNLQINGAGSGQTTITAAGIPDLDRVIHFIDVETAGMTGVEITGGDVSSNADFGGGIAAQTLNLNLQDVHITGNKAGFGGGLATQCSPSITDSVIDANQALRPDNGGDGGGIYLAAFDGCSANFFATIQNTSISGNNAENSGGGMFLQGGFNDPPANMLMSNSVVDGNTANGGGGGINNDLFTAAGITNSTISRNHSLQASGGGISDDSEFLFLTNTTISTNDANAVGGGISTSNGLKGAYNVTIAFNHSDTSGGGVFNFNEDTASGFDTRIFNTIIAKNTATTSDPDCSGDFPSGGNNLIGALDPANCTNFTDGVMNDQVGTIATPIDPLLGPLQYNGGNLLLQTHALDRNSTAVDRGNSTPGCQAIDQQAFFESGFDTGSIAFVNLTTDERPFTRPIGILDPNTPICDIGAFELQTFTFDVTKDDGLGGASIDVDENFTYTITVTNTGPGDANAVTLSDPLPTQVAFVSLTTTQGTCAPAGNAISCDLGDMPVGSTVTVTVTVTATTPGSAVNVVTVTSNQLTFQATETTTIVQSGPLGFLEGSGFHCSLSRQGPVSAKGMASLALFAVVAGLIQWRLRRRAQ